MKGMLGKTEIGLFVALAVLLLAKLILPDWAVTLGTVALARGLVVLGLLILWRTGLISFGQALFFGTGGYTVGLLRVYGGLTDIFVLTLLAFLFAGLLAYLLGLLISRYREIFFAMLCLAFSMMLYGVLVKTSFGAFPLRSKLLREHRQLFQFPWPHDRGFFLEAAPFFLLNSY